MPSWGTRSIRMSGHSVIVAMTQTFGYTPIQSVWIMMLVSLKAAARGLRNCAKSGRMSDGL
jgi:hypothetical protein